WKTTMATPIPATCLYSQAMSTHPKPCERHSGGLNYRVLLVINITYKKLWIYVSIHNAA
ncbi:hypothetical protein SK128_005208, partial [Halocaridina rubra]